MYIYEVTMNVRNVSENTIIVTAKMTLQQPKSPESLSSWLSVKFITHSAILSKFKWNAETRNKNEMSITEAQETLGMLGLNYNKLLCQIMIKILDNIIKNMIKTSQVKKIMIYTLYEITLFHKITSGK